VLKLVDTIGFRRMVINFNLTSHELFLYAAGFSRVEFHFSLLGPKTELQAEIENSMR